MAFAHDTHRSYAAASVWQRLSDLRADLVERFAKYRVYRATVNELSMLSERELSDLGLSHSDIPAVARQAAYSA
jgi:uncharacterized protein YjiS (DUF1127 family)